MEWKFGESEERNSAGKLCSKTKEKKRNAEVTTKLQNDAR